MLKNFNDIRKEKKVSLVDLADLLEVRYQTVADKING
ncbi:MAG: XRE family transcriptional regulator, partial [Staphylococcus epidermidis]|nr:XRE family transcriptional regulator [Staphylococcus epidermidis]MDU7272151.1 XRE family transcriptional regulator [Staphylococcus lugdunensis]